MTTWSCDPSLTAEITSTYRNALPTFANTLQTFLAAQCALIGDHLWPEDALESVLQDPNYDFIVVGAGSAGSVVANRLSEVPHWKVLLIEAGGNPTFTTEIPQLITNNWKSPVDWAYKLEPQEGSCRGYKNNTCSWPHGKVLGGSSSINAMLYVRGNKLDYDEWAASGNTGWSYEEIFPYFFKSENYSEPLSEDLKKFHSKEGYLSVECRNDAQEFEKMIIAAASQLGIKSLTDINGADQMGVTKSCTTTKNGVRHSTARAFLAPIKDRQNLHVLKNAYVTKILFKNKNKVSGVLVNKDGKEIRIRSKKEVIVSAGAMQTPQLLMLSGIGPKKHLESLGIKVRTDLPVGQNLQDHVYVPINYKSKEDKSQTSTPGLVDAFAEYILQREGFMNTTAPARVISFMNTTDNDATSPDTEFSYVFLPPNNKNPVDFYVLQDFDDEYQRKMQEVNENNYLLIVFTTLLHPKSRGKIELKSTNPFEKPRIYANYFEDPEDMETIIRAFRQHSLKLGDTDAFKSVGFELNWIELDACKQFDKNTDEFLRCWIVQSTDTIHHHTSTAKMGPDADETAVVNPELKVRKVDRLRVIDSSIMPIVTRGNTNAPTIMIGEKGADMIKKFWLAK
ncbi:GMC oxidoreductase domain-containing protein [Phthorimaea operculella]|nr:GMC oxidoreductase domain-containing protein [Phthorimaea operculella]